MSLDLNKLRKDWETGNYRCSWESFQRWWAGATLAEYESFQINAEHARKLDLEAKAGE